MFKYPEYKIFENEYVKLRPMSIDDSSELFNISEKDSDKIFYHMFFGPFNTETDTREYIKNEYGN